MQRKNIKNQNSLIRLTALSILFLLIWAYVFFRRGDTTPGTIFILIMFWLATIFFLPPMNVYRPGSVIRIRRIIFLPFVLVSVILACWFNGSTFLGMIIFVFIIFAWLIPFLIRVENERKFIRKKLFLVAIVISLGFFFLPIKSTVKRLKEGDSQLKRVSWIKVDDPNITASDLEILSGSRNIRILSLKNIQYSEDLFQKVSAIASLTVFRLINIQINGKDLEELSSLKYLKTLILNNVDIIGEDMSSLTSLDRLEWLTLKRTKISPEDLLEFANKENLKTIVIEGTEIPDEVVSTIKNNHPDIDFSYSAP